MKILFPFVGDSFGGSHVSSLNLYLGLVNKGITVLIVIHNNNGPLSKYLTDKNIPFVVLNAPNLAGESPNKFLIFFAILANFFQFRKFIVDNKIDIIHGNDLRINLSWFLPAKVLSKKFVWHQRTVLSQSKMWLLIKYLCDYFVAISAVVMKSAPQNISANKRKIVYNPFNTPSSSIDKATERNNIISKYKLPQSCFLLGCIGRIVDYKNIDFVIENLYDICNNINKDTYLIIVGTGPKEYIGDLKKLVKNKGIDNHVIFTGFLNNPNSVMASLNLLVAPSTIDAFGRTIVEAMLLRVPVLAANYGGHKDIVFDKINGFLYDPTIAGNFTNKIATVMSGNYTNRLSDKAYDLARSNFSSDQHVKSILLIYNILLKYEN